MTALMFSFGLSPTFVLVLRIAGTCDVQCDNGTVSTGVFSSDLRAAEGRTGRLKQQRKAKQKLKSLSTSRKKSAKKVKKRKKKTSHPDDSGDSAKSKNSSRHRTSDGAAQHNFTKGTAVEARFKGKTKWLVRLGISLLFNHDARSAVQRPLHVACAGIVERCPECTATGPTILSMRMATKKVMCQQITCERLEILDKLAAMRLFLMVAFVAIGVTTRAKVAKKQSASATRTLVSLREDKKLRRVLKAKRSGTRERYLECAPVVRLHRPCGRTLSNAVYY